MNDLNVFVAFRGDHLSEEARHSLETNAAGDLAKLNQRIEQGNGLFRSWAEGNGGAVVAMIGDGGRVRLTADHLHDLQRICDSYKHEVGVPVSVGVGAKLSEAEKALEYAIVTGGGKIELFEKEMLQELEELKDPNHPVRTAATFLNKAEPPLNTPAAGGGMTGPSMGGQAAPMRPTPEGSEHSENEALQNMLAEQPDAAEPPDLAGQFGQLAQESEGREQQAQQQEQQQKQDDEDSENVRQQIVEVLKEFKEMGPLWEQLKQAQPKAYKTLSQMMQAMIVMGRQLYGQDDQAQQQEQPVQKSESRELLVGGAGDNIPDEEFSDDALAIGTKTEQKEHGLDPKRAKEVAKDHLVEDPKAYDVKKTGEIRHIIKDSETGEHQVAQSAGFKLKHAKKPGKTGRFEVRLPVGSAKHPGPATNADGGQIKVVGPNGEQWREVRAGMVMGPNGQAVSARNPSGK